MLSKLGSTVNHTFIEKPLELESQFESVAANGFWTPAIWSLRGN